MHPAATRYPGSRHDEGDARGPVVEAHLVPQATLSKHIAVVAAEDHDGVIQHPGPSQRIEDCPDELIDVRDASVVGMPGPLHVCGRNAQLAPVILVPEAATVRVA